MVSIQGAVHGQAAALEDVGVDHGGAYVLVAEEFLDGADVVTGLEKVGSEGVTEGVAGDALLDFGPLRSPFDGALQAGGVEVMAAHFAAAGVKGASGSRKEILPDKLLGGVGVLFLQGVGQIDLSVASGQVLFVEQAHPFDLAVQFGEGNDAVLLALAIADGNGAVLKINVLDSQADAFHQAQAGAVEELGHQFVNAVEVVDEARGFAELVEQFFATVLDFP
jgi:hypothetical protein